MTARTSVARASGGTMCRAASHDLHHFDGATGFPSRRESHERTTAGRYFRLFPVRMWEPCGSAARTFGVAPSPTGKLSSYPVEAIAPELIR